MCLFSVLNASSWHGLLPVKIGGFLRKYTFGFQYQPFYLFFSAFLNGVENFELRGRVWKCAVWFLIRQWFIYFHFSFLAIPFNGKSISILRKEREKSCFPHLRPRDCCKSRTSFPLTQILATGRQVKIQWTYRLD